MTTPFLALSTLVRDAITGAPALGRGKVLRGRGVTLPQAETKGVRINTLGHGGDLLDMAGDTVQWDGQISISVLGRATPDQDAEEAIDDLLQQVWQRVAAITWPAGAVQSAALRPDIRWAADEADSTVTEATFILRCTHFTAAATLAAA